MCTAHGMKPATSAAAMASCTTGTGRTWGRVIRSVRAAPVAATAVAPAPFSPEPSEPSEPPVRSTASRPRSGSPALRRPAYPATTPNSRATPAPPAAVISSAVCSTRRCGVE